MRIVFILAGIVLMLAGLALLGVGALWSGADGALTGPFSSEQFVQLHIVPAVSPVASEIISLIPNAAREFVFFGEYGLLTTVGVLGILVFLFGGTLLRNLPKGSGSRAVIRKNKEKVKGEVKKREAAKKAAAEVAGASVAASAPAAAKGAALSAADEEKLLGGPKKTGIFDGMEEDEKTNHMVSLFHAALEKSQCEELLNLFRPQLTKFMDLYRDDALSILTKQALELEIIRRRRQQEDISPDQFRTFDDKITQLDREAVCYRYLPANPGGAPEEARQHFGLVYDRFSHSAVQQKLKSDADDWRKVTMRNAAEVLSEKAPPRSPPKPSDSDSDSSGDDSEKSAA